MIPPLGVLRGLSLYAGRQPPSGIASLPNSVLDYELGEAEPSSHVTAQLQK